MTSLNPRRAMAVAAIVTAGVLGPVTQPASAETITGSAVPENRSVTLVTGDKVFLDNAGKATVHAGQGRAKIGFVTRKDLTGDVYVTPFDALGPIRAGQLDPRLFDVTRLLAEGYGDDSRPDIPLIVSHPAGLKSAQVSNSAHVVRELPSVRATAVTTAKGSSFWNQRGAGKVWLDGPVHAVLDKSVPQIGAPEAWKAGHTGKDTTVAILDTGIDPTHPDLTDAVAEARDFTGSASGTVDKYGHGTHVASIVTGNNSKYEGVAPDTRLLIGKVLDDSGSGTESGILAGMDWAAHSSARIVNMSLGDSTPSDGTDLISQALNNLTAETGVLFVVASGNNGKTPGTPAAAEAALTVGAVDHNDKLADFSSRGPRKGDNGVKPEITAPGVDITAAMAKDSFLAGRLPHADDTHLVMSGTSMATPHVTGAAAILAGEHPDWKAPQLKAALVGSAKPDPALSVFEQGAGRVDVARAYQANLVATPASINDGVAQWPHTDDQPVRNVVTFHNYGPAPVTVPVRADITGPAGQVTPTGMFALSATSLTVAPGADAQVTLTADTKVNGPDGIYGGVVAAGDTRIPVSITREPESYDVKLNFVGSDGKPTSDYAYRLVNTTQAVQYVPYDASGSLTIRAEKGHYYFESQVLTGEGKLAVTIEPDVDLSKPVTITVDPRTAKPAGLVLDRTDATPFEKNVEFARTTAWGGKDVLDTSISPGEYGDVLVNASTSRAPGQFRYSVGGRFAQQDASGGFDGTSYLYNVRADVDGRMPAEPVMRVHDKDLVHVHTQHHATRPGTVGTREGIITKPLPYALEELYSPETPWMNDFAVYTTDGRYLNRQFSSAPKVFPKVREANDTYNRAVFGPDFPANPSNPARYASRRGDGMILQIPWYSDANPNEEGFSLHSGTAVLSKDGVRVGSGDPVGGFFEVPPGPGTYTLHADALRDELVSGRIVADWTFRSDTVTGDEAQRLSLMALKFTPPVDTNNRVSTLLPTIVPVSVSHNSGGQARPTNLQVSHDKGATWRYAPLIDLGGRWYTVLFHSRGAKSVSLKGTAVDQAGNSVTETIVDAFLLK
jgi:subtilisin family serine protease